MPRGCIVRYPAHIVSSTGTPRTKSLGRAVDLLREVARGPSRSASELARSAGLPRSTAARTLRTLADAGLVEEDAGGWVLGYELVRLARAADPHRSLLEAARPALARLRDATGESALLAVPHGRPGMEILLQLDAGRHVGVANWVGADVPLHASSAGKLVLAELGEEELDMWLRSAPLPRFTSTTIVEPEPLRAELQRVRRAGSAELVDELEDGLASISAAVHGADGRLAAMVGVSGPTFRLGRSRRRELLPEVRATAVEIERRLSR
jgi:DNA-binding IclR family transcriptional regulator